MKFGQSYIPWIHDFSISKPAVLFITDKYWPKDKEFGLFGMMKHLGYDQKHDSSGAVRHSYANLAWKKFQSWKKNFKIEKLFQVWKDLKDEQVVQSWKNILK